MRADLKPNASWTKGDLVAKGLIPVEDPLFEEAKVALPNGEEFPVSFLQRRFRLGYTRACTLYLALQASREGSRPVV